MSDGSGVRRIEECYLLGSLGSKVGTEIVSYDGVSVENIVGKLEGSSILRMLVLN